MKSASVSKAFQFQTLQSISEYLGFHFGLEQFAGIVSGRGFEGVEHCRIIEHHLVFGDGEDAVSQSRDRFAILGIDWAQVLIEPAGFRFFFGRLREQS